MVSFIKTFRNNFDSLAPDAEQASIEFRTGGAGEAPLGVAEKAVRVTEYMRRLRVSVVQTVQELRPEHAASQETSIE